MIAPHTPQTHVGGFMVLAGLQAAMALILVAIPRDWSARFVPPLVVIAGIAAVSAALMLNGEDRGGPATLNELYYVWPALYVGYFFRRRGTIGSVVIIAVAYAWVLHALRIDGSLAVTRWIVTMSVVAGAATALHAIRAQIDHLVARLRATARTDALTGVLNRRGFEELCGPQVASAPCALLLGDIDHFKRLNDRLGHAAGDTALAAVARHLSDVAGPGDTVARIGGEEFAVLVPGADREAAVAVAEAMRASVDHSPGDAHPLTISFGVAAAPHDGGTLLELMSAADTALYAAKARGRNRTVASAGGDDLPPVWIGDALAAATETP
jgi:diguanylate cyclase (GGDEF)-like protein